MFLNHSGEDIKISPSAIREAWFEDEDGVRRGWNGLVSGLLKQNLVFVDQNGEILPLDVSAEQISQNTSLPSAAEFFLVLMSRQRRSDVLNDLTDWWPDWAMKSRRWAYFCCAWKIADAILGGFLDFLGRVAEAVGKFRGAK